MPETIYFTIISFLVFITGTSFASFICVLRERGLVLGRSECVSCKKNLNFYELIPIFSYIFLRGKCLSCKVRIPATLFLSEILLGSWFLSSFIYFDIFTMGFTWIFLVTLVFGIIFFYLVLEDMVNMEISTKILNIFVALSILVSIIIFHTSQNFLNIIIPFIIFLVFYFINLIKSEALGEADAFIYLAIGLFFGGQIVVSVFLYSIWLATFFSILIMYLKNYKFVRHTKIPFLPYIFIATTITLFTNFHIIDFREISLALSMLNW